MDNDLREALIELAAELAMARDDSSPENMRAALDGASEQLLLLVDEHWQRNTIPILRVFGGPEVKHG